MSTTTETIQDEWLKLPIEGQQANWQQLPVRGAMLSMRFDWTDPDVFARCIDAAADAGLNTLMVEVEQALQYDSFPTVSPDWALDRKTMRQLVTRARDRGLNCIPLLPTLPHCYYLANAFPEIREGSAGVAAVICPRHPLTKKVLSGLIDELLEVFEPEYFNIGNDELISSFNAKTRTSSVLECPRCKDTDAAEWLLESTHHWQGYLAERGVRTMMWADMLLNPDDFRNYSMRYGSVFGGAPDYFHRALEGLSRDIVLCDWQYDACRDFPTNPYLQSKGFKVIGCPKNEEGSFLYTRYAQRERSENFLGMIVTDWGRIQPFRQARIVAKLHNNGRIFNGADWPNLRLRAEAADRREFGPGPFTHHTRFNKSEQGLIDVSGYEQFRGSGDEEWDGLKVKSKRTGELWMQFKAASQSTFKSFVTTIDYADVGPAEIAVSVNDATDYSTIPLEREIDWSTGIEGAHTVTLYLNITNAKGEDRTPALFGISVSGNMA